MLSPLPALLQRPAPSDTCPEPDTQAQAAFFREHGFCIIRSLLPHGSEGLAAMQESFARVEPAAREAWQRSTVEDFAAKQVRETPPSFSLSSQKARILPRQARDKRKENSAQRKGGGVSRRLPSAARFVRMRSLTGRWTPPLISRCCARTSFCPCCKSSWATTCR